VCLRVWDLSRGPVNRFCAKISSLDFLSSRLICSAQNLFWPVLSSLEREVRKRFPARVGLVGCLESAALARFQAPGTFSIEIFRSRAPAYDPCVSGPVTDFPCCVFRFGLRSTICAPVSAVNFPAAKESGFWSRAKGAHDSRFDFPLNVLWLSAESVFVLSSRLCSLAALRTSGGGQWPVCFSLQPSSSRRLLFCSISLCASALMFRVMR
jgi:hypothetical protein